MGGDFAAPQDRFSGAEPDQLQPFDRYVNTTSFPATVDYGSYPPGSAPMVDTSAVAPNRVQTSSITPGLLDAPADLANFSEGMSAQRQAAPSDLAIDQSRFDGLGLSVGVIDASRLYSDPKSSRIGQTPAMDAVRMPGLLDPTTNTQSRPAVHSNAMVQTNPSLLGSVKNAINPGTLGGGLLGSLGGPIGTVAGGLLGNSVYQNGGFQGLLSPSVVAPSNQIPGGMTNTSGIYNGAYSPGTYAVASNGATITAQPAAGRATQTRTVSRI